jgi:hypothetical protein
VVLRAMRQHNLFRTQGQQMTAIINAFHPDYIKTYHPELLTAIKLESTQHANGVIAGGKSKATRENKHGKTVNTINVFPKTQSVQRTLEKAKSRTDMEELKRRILAPTEFFTFSKAGTANTTKTKKK